MKTKSCTKPEKWILAGIPVLFLVGSLVHFLYEFSGENPIVGLFSPMNESVWEHLKLVLWPLFLWWSLFYYFQKDSYEIPKEPWFTAALAALLTALISIPLLYYFYTQAFGKELLWADVVILFLALSFGQFLGLHLYRRGAGLDARFLLAVFVSIFLVFLIFTWMPPEIPLFLDPSSGTS